MRLRPRIDRLERYAPLPEEQRVTEIHHHIINPDHTPALSPDGTPMVIVSRVKDAGRGCGENCSTLHPAPWPKAGPHS